MIKPLRKISAGGLLLACSTAAAIGFTYWLLAESDDEKVRNVYIEHDRLVLVGRNKEAAALLAAAISSTGSGPLDPIWLPLVQTRVNGFEQFVYYERILMGDPEHARTYKAIAGLIKASPQSFHDQVKARYLASLAAIPGVRRDLLEKYGLLIEQQNQKQPAEPAAQ